MTRVLILGGTAEGAALARALAPRPDLHVITSLAGRTRRPDALPGEVRSGGFGGIEGLFRFLVENGIARVVDATHPFAARMAANAHAACARAGVPRLRLLRPPWTRHAGDRWHEVDDMAAAAHLVPRLGRRVFLTTGHAGLEAFADLPGLWFLVRSIEPPERLPLRRATWITGRGPFRVEDEIALLRRHAVEVLVTKASGGGATYAKIAAARALGLPVVMVRRPPPPPGPVAPSVEAALDWLRAAHAGPVPAGGRST